MGPGGGAPGVPGTRVSVPPDSAGLLSGRLAWLSAGGQRRQVVEQGLPFRGSSALCVVPPRSPGTGAPPASGGRSGACRRPARPGPPMALTVNVSCPWLASGVDTSERSSIRRLFAFRASHDPDGGPVRFTSAAAAGSGPLRPPPSGRRQSASVADRDPSSSPRSHEGAAQRETAWPAAAGGIVRGQRFGFPASG